MLWCLAQVLMLIVFSLRLSSTTECSESINVTQERTRITSPSWPDVYGPNITCCWNISTSNNFWIKVSFLNFSLEDSFDYLTIESGNLTRQITGNPCRPLSYVIHNSFLIRFTSDHSIQLTGFKAVLQAINRSSVPRRSDLTSSHSKLLRIFEPVSQHANATPCQTSLEAIENETMLNYTFPGDGYGSEVNCSWNILNPFGKRIIIEFDVFESEACCDYLILIDGGYPVRLMQGTQCPEPYQSSTSNLTLMFRSDQNISGLGFQARFKSIDSSAANVEQEENRPKDFFSSASSRLASNHLFCDSNLNGTTDQDLKRSMHTVNTFWFFPYKTTESSSEVNEVCNSSTAEENLESLLQTPDLTITKPLLEDVVEIISDVLSGTEESPIPIPSRASSPEKQENPIITNYLNFLKNFSERAALNLPSSSNNFNNETEVSISIQTPLINVEIKKISRSSDSNANFSNLTFDLKDSKSNKRIEIVIPSKTVDAVSRNSENLEPIFVVSIIGKLKSSQAERNLSQIVSVSAVNSSPDRNISFEAKLNGEEIPKENIKLNDTVKDKLSMVQVVEWDFELSIWKISDRCETINKKPLTFRCRGFGSFSALFSSRVVPSAASLRIFSEVGSWLSIIFLLATVSIHLGFRELRKKSTTTMLVNICFCLIAIYLLFFFGIGLVEDSTTCNVFAFLLHYTTLTCMLLMTVNSYNLYRAVSKVKVANLELNPLMYLAIYGFFFIWVLLNFSITILYLDKKIPKDIYFESKYRARHMCWLRAPSFTWGFLLPFGLMVIFNYSLFPILLKKIVFRKKKVRSTVKDQSLVDRLIQVVIMVTSMGLTWIFGYFLLIPLNVAYESAMQWLFTLFNVFQGVVIFYLYCVRPKNVRKIWMCNVPKISTSSDLVVYHKQNTKSSELLTHKTNSVL